MRDWLKTLTGCKDVITLRSAIYELCGEFGEISRFDIMALSRSGKHQALCFFQLESAAQERQLMASFGASRFGDDLLLVVDLPAEPANVAEQRGDSLRDQTRYDESVAHPWLGRNENAGGKKFWFDDRDDIHYRFGA